MKRSLYARLSAMMFLFYVAAGVTIPILSLYMHSVLRFTGMQIGMVLSLSMLSAVTAPLIGSFIADRVLPAESVLGVTQIGAGICIFFIASQDSFRPFFLMYAVYQLLFGPGVALTNAVVFHHSPNARRQFGGVRLWGTAGWITAAWFFSLFWLGSAGGALGDALIFSGAVSIVLGLFAFTLSPSVKKPPRRRELVPRAAIRLMMNPQLSIAVLAGVVVQLVDKYYYFGAAPYLKSLGFAESAIMPAMSLGQATEIVAMLLLGILLTRFGFRKVMFLGILMELGRFSCFIFGAGKVSALMGIFFHGPAFAFFFAAAFIFIDSFADTESRAGIQQLFNVMTIGIGNFLGSILAGFVFERAAIAGGAGSSAAGAVVSAAGGAGTAGAGNMAEAAGTSGLAAGTPSISAAVNYRFFWSVPAVLVVIVLAILFFWAVRRRILSD